MLTISFFVGEERYFISKIDMKLLLQYFQNLHMDDIIYPSYILFVELTSRIFINRHSICERLLHWIYRLSEYEEHSTLNFRTSFTTWQFALRTRRHPQDTTGQTESNNSSSSVDGSSSIGGQRYNISNTRYSKKISQPRKQQHPHTRAANNKNWYCTRTHDSRTLNTAASASFAPPSRSTCNPIAL